MLHVCGWCSALETDVFVNGWYSGLRKGVFTCVWMVLYASTLHLHDYKCMSMWVAL